MQETYKEFIQNILDTRGRFACGDEYHERHHIVPKSCGGGNEQENLIDLYAREHYEAHRLLALENPDNVKLVRAWWMMSHMSEAHQRDYELTAEEYEEARKAFRESMSGENNPSYGKTIKERLGDDVYKVWIKKQRELNRSGPNNPMYGVSPQERMDEETFKQWTEKIRIAMSGENNPNYGVKMSDEQKQKISKAKIGARLTEEEKLRRRNNAPVRTPVYCFELCMYYKSAAEAERCTGVCARTILSYCSGDPVRKSAGKHPGTGEPLHWRKASIDEYNSFINNLQLERE